MIPDTPANHRDAAIDDHPGGPAWHPGRALMHVLSRSAPHRRLSILIYHRVLPRRDPLFPGEIDACDFDKQLALLKTCFHIMPLANAVRRLRAGTLPPRAACITFDDGYADNADIALPLLRKYRLPATFFIASGFLDGGRMWSDTVIELVRRAPGDLLDLQPLQLGVHAIATTQQRQQAITALLNRLKYLPVDERHAQTEHLHTHLNLRLPDDLMMTSAQVRALHEAGMEIGAHTVTHPILTAVDDWRAHDEIANGKEALEHIIGAPVRLFAYPNGKPMQDYLPAHVGMVKKIGFEAAVSTTWGTACATDDWYQLPRFTPWDRNPLRFVLRMARNMLHGPAANVADAAP
jgi:peptidoglycan/xylan/chitin deacetylase (PgdA/CDA1 family)